MSRRAVARRRGWRCGGRSVWRRRRCSWPAGGAARELDARLAGDDSPAADRGLDRPWRYGEEIVAVEYAHRHLAEVGAAWQFPAEDPTVLAAGFGELAAHSGPDFVTRDPVATVHGVLAAVRVRWRLVFDNAPDRASVELFLPPEGPGSGADHQPEPPLAHGPGPGGAGPGPRVSAGFLVNRTGDPDRRAAVELAGELGGCRWRWSRPPHCMQATWDSLAGYLASFRQRRPGCWPGGSPPGITRRSRPPGGWRSQDGGAGRAERGRAVAAAGVLRAGGGPAAPAAPYRAGVRPVARPEVAPVLVPLLEDERRPGDAIGALRRYSLISPPADGSVSVHRLVQAVTADQMPAELVRQWRQAAAALIEAAIPRDTAQPGTWPDVRGAAATRPGCP